LASLTIYSAVTLHAELTRRLPPTRSLPVASLTVYPPAARHGVFPALFTFRLGRKAPSGSHRDRETRVPHEKNPALPDQSRRPDLRFRPFVFSNAPALFAT